MTENASDRAHPGAVSTRVVLKPLATPLPLGFLALAVATIAFASVQLCWIPQDQGRTVGLRVLVLTVPLQLLAAVMGFLARDPDAQLRAWASSVAPGAQHAWPPWPPPPGATSQGLGVILRSRRCMPAGTRSRRPVQCRTGAGHSHQRAHRDRRDRRRPDLDADRRLGRRRAGGDQRLRRAGPGAGRKRIAHNSPARPDRPQQPGSRRTAGRPGPPYRHRARRPPTALNRRRWRPNKPDQPRR